MSTDLADADLSWWVRGGLATVHAVLVVLVVFLSAVAVATPVRGLLVGGPVVADSPLDQALTTGLQFVGFFVGVALYLGALREWDLVRGRVRTPTSRDLVWTVGGLVGLLGLSVTLSAVLGALGIEMAQNQVITQGDRNPVLYLYLLPVTLLLVAPAEELVFRGVVQGLFRRVVGPAPAIAAASVLFGVAHWLALTGGGGGRVSYVLVAAVLGVVLGVAYERTANLVVPTLIHGLYNVSRFLLGYVVATGLV